MMTEKMVLVKHKNVYAKISSFLADKALRSNQTAKSYEEDIRQFFQIMCNKKIEQLTTDDLVFESNHIVDYKIALANQYSGASVNRKLNVIKNLFRFLSKDFEFINQEVFHVDRVKEKSKSYGTLTWEETVLMIETAESLDNGFEKSVMIELAGRTSIRLTALANLRWSDISEMNDFYVISVYDKGEKLDEKPIPAVFYQKMLKLKTSKNEVFSLSPRTFERTIDTLCELIGIDKENRNITFHSLKKMGVEYILQKTGDIMLAAKQGNHSNIQTTHRHYALMTRKNSIGKLAGLQLGKELDMSPIQEVSKERLLEMINAMDDYTKSKFLEMCK